MIGIPIGLLSANAFEWWMHKYILHGKGVNKRSFWKFHWHDHHRIVRHAGHIDDAYEGSVLRWNTHGKEALLLAGAFVSIVPLYPVAPFFAGTWHYCIWNYYRKHKRAHLDPEWAREHLTWHYDHHMGPEQHANWCVTKPWWDLLMGTRKPYAGTPREAADRERAAVRARLRRGERAAATPPG